MSDQKQQMNPWNKPKHPFTPESEPQKPVSAAPRERGAPPPYRRRSMGPFPPRSEEMETEDALDLREDWGLDDAEVESEPLLTWSGRIEAEAPEKPPAQERRVRIGKKRKHVPEEDPFETKLASEELEGWPAQPTERDPLDYLDQSGSEAAEPPAAEKWVQRTPRGRVEKPAWVPPSTEGRSDEFDRLVGRGTPARVESRPVVQETVRPIVGRRVDLVEAMTCPHCRSSLIPICYEYPYMDDTLVVLGCSNCRKVVGTTIKKTSLLERAFELITRLVRG